MEGGPYAVLITLVGVLLDWPYLNLAWRLELESKTQTWVPLHNVPVQLVLLLLPMVLLAAANFALSILLWHLDVKRALKLSGFMGFLTAPWALVFVPYLLGWA